MTKLCAILKRVNIVADIRYVKNVKHLSHSQRTNWKLPLRTD